MLGGSGFVVARRVMKTSAIRALGFSIFTTSLLRWGGWFGGRGWQRQKRIVSDTNSLLPGGRVPWPFWLKVHAVPR